MFKAKCLRTVLGTVLETGRPRSGCWRGGLLLVPLSLACRGPPALCLFTPSPGCACVPRPLCVLTALSSLPPAGPLICFPTRFVRNEMTTQSATALERRVEFVPRGPVGRGQAPPPPPCSPQQPCSASLSLWCSGLNAVSIAKHPLFKSQERIYPLSLQLGSFVMLLPTPTLRSLSLSSCPEFSKAGINQQGVCCVGGGDIFNPHEALRAGQFRLKCTPPPSPVL